MTTIINFITTSYTSSSPYSLLSDGIAVISIGLLLTLLIEKVLLDAYEGDPVESKAHAFKIVIVPTLFVLTAIVFLRIVQIINTG